MTLLQLIPILAALGFVVYNVGHPTFDGTPGPNSWILPAVLSAGFLAFTLYGVAVEGLVQFWINHTNTITGNQVWLDLLLAISIAFTLMAPEARRLGMKPALWLVAICLTGCIAVLAMLARMFWLKARMGEMPAAAAS
ncbi:MAG: hypothetical protein AAGM21_09380 [Pseudomonadota bacterium]